MGIMLYFLVIGNAGCISSTVIPTLGAKFINPADLGLFGATAF